MKKYQLWLQRKSYSQHLFNLMRIKCAQHSPDRLNKTSYKHSGKENSYLQKYKQMEQYQEEASKLGDISYAITFKELKNRKLRLMKSFEILNQNMSMARRIKEVKSVFHAKDKNVQGESNKRKVFEKKCQLSNQQLRKQSMQCPYQVFKKYIKVQNNSSKCTTKYRLTLTFVSAPKIFHAHDEFVAFWSELHTEKGVVRSDLLKKEQLQGQTVSFPIEDPLEREPILRIFFSKGISSEQVGNFLLIKPELGWTPKTFEVNSQDNRMNLHLRMSYNYTRRQKPSFTFK